MQNMNLRFIGTEIAFDYKVSHTVSITGAAALNQAFHTNRPVVQVYGDNDTSVVAVSRETYLTNYYLSVGPQSAYSLGGKYSSRHYWFGVLTFNFFDRNYIDVNPDRRTPAAIAAGIPGSAASHDVLGQQKLPAFFTADMFVYKSVLLSALFKFLPEKTFLYLSVGVNNILNNRSIKTGGFEQLRFDPAMPDKFPPKYFIGYGRTYFANVSLKI